MDWEKVGVIGVDAGLCWIGDPCYIMHQIHKKDATTKSLRTPKPKPKEVGKDWLGFCDIHWDKERKQKSQAVQYNHDMGHPGLGVCTSTGYGDGQYDVFVKKNKEGCIAEVKVVFIDEEKDNDLDW